jgi:hypothetical protein
LLQLQEGKEARTIARARTLSTLNQLDDTDDNSRNDFYKGSLIKFLVEAELIDGKEPGISLSEADFSEVDLSETDLSGANLSGADLSGANLSEPKYIYLNNKQIKSACFWEEALHTGGVISTKKGWILSDKQANQKRIEEIRKDETSDPKDTPNCDRWGSRSQL